MQIVIIYDFFFLLLIFSFLCSLSYLEQDAEQVGAT